MTESMSHCENCGAALAPGLRFCGVCGQPVQSKFCEQCGAKLTPGIRFCESCGSPAGGLAPVQPMPQPPLAQPTPAAQAWQAPLPAAAWTQPTDGLSDERPRARKKRRGCWWVLLVLILLLLALVAAAVLLGWVSYTAGNLIIFPDGVPFIATPIP